MAKSQYLATSQIEDGKVEWTFDAERKRGLLNALLFEQGHDPECPGCTRQFFEKLKEAVSKVEMKANRARVNSERVDYMAAVAHELQSLPRHDREGGQQHS